MNLPTLDIFEGLEASLTAQRFMVTEILVAEPETRPRDRRKAASKAASPRILGLRFRRIRRGQDGALGISGLADGIEDRPGADRAGDDGRVVLLRDGGKIGVVVEIMAVKGLRAIAVLHAEDGWRTTRALFDAGYIRCATVTAAEQTFECYLRSDLIRRPLRVRGQTRGVVAMSRLGANGRFANQLFQYAFIKLYALRHELSVATPMWDGAGLFGIDDPAPEPEKLLHLGFYAFDDDDLGVWTADRPPVDVDFDGYFQELPPCWAPHRSLVRRMFRPQAEITRRLDDWRDELTSSGRREFVAIHVRRGDYPGLYAQGLGWYRPIPLEWYRAWLTELRDTLNDPVIYVATDAPDDVFLYFADLTPVGASHLPGGPDIPGHIVDFEMLRRADHLAVANSSFSRMASILAPDRQAAAIADFQSESFAPYDAWSDRRFWDRFAPSDGEARGFGSSPEAARQRSLQLRLELSQSRRACDDLLLEKNQLKIEKRDIQRQGDASGEHLLEYKKLISEKDQFIGKLSAENNEIQRQSDILSVNLADYKVVVSKNDLFIVKLIEENNNAQIQNDNYSESLLEYKKLVSDKDQLIDNLKADNDQIQRQSDILRAQLAEHKDVISENGQLIVELTAEKNEIQLSSDIFSEQLVRYKKFVAEKDEYIEYLRAEVRTHASLREADAERLSALTSTRVALQGAWADIASFKDLVSKRDQLVDALLLQIEDDKSSMSARDADIARLSAEIRTTKILREADAERLRALGSTSLALQAAWVEAQTLSERHATLEQSYGLLQSQHVALRNSSDVLNNELSQASAMQDALASARTEAEQTLQTLRERYVAVEQAYGSLRSQHVALKESFDALEGRHGMLNDDLARVSAARDAVASAHRETDRALQTALFLASPRGLARRLAARPVLATLGLSRQLASSLKLPIAAKLGDDEQLLRDRRYRHWAGLMRRRIARVMPGRRSKAAPPGSTHDGAGALDRREDADAPAIVVVVPWLLQGGSEMVLLDVLGGLSRHFKLTIVTTIEADHAMVEAFRPIVRDIHHLGSPPDPSGDIAFLSALCHEQQAALIFSSNASLIYQQAARIKEDNPCLKIIDLLHNASNEGHFASALAASAHIDRQIVVGQHISDALQAEGVPSERITTISNAIDLDVTFNPNLTSSRDGRRFLGLHAGDFVIGYVGRMSSEKRPNAFLDIVEGLPDIRNLRIVMVGSGPLDTTIEARLQGFRCPVVWRQHLSRAEMNKVYAALDVLVLPSTIEGMPLVVLEAMAMGVPVAATDVGNVRDIIDPDVNGFVVGIDRYMDLAQPIARLAGDPRMHKAMRRAARTAISEKSLGRSAMLDIYTRLFKDVAGIPH